MGWERAKTWNLHPNNFSIRSGKVDKGAHFFEMSIHVSIHANHLFRHECLNVFACRAPSNLFSSSPRRSSSWAVKTSSSGFAGRISTSPCAVSQAALYFANICLQARTAGHSGKLPTRPSNQVSLLPSVTLRVGMRLSWLRSFLSRWGTQRLAIPLCKAMMQE